MKTPLMLDYIIGVKRWCAKHNQGFGGSTSVTEVAVNFKIGVQRVRLNLCKSGLGAAYRARVYRLEHGRLGFERRILKTHVRSLRPTLVRCGLRTLDQQIFLKLNRNTWALGFGVSNHPVSSNSSEESVQNCSHDLVVHRLCQVCERPISKAPSSKKARTMNSNAQRAVAVVSYLMRTMTRKE